MLKLSRTFSNIHEYPLPLSRNFGVDTISSVASVVKKKRSVEKFVPSVRQNNPIES